MSMSKELKYLYKCAEQDAMRQFKEESQGNLRAAYQLGYIGGVERFCHAGTFEGLDATNKIHWHDASKEMPFALTEKEDEAHIVAVGEKDDELTWHQAFYEKGKWVCHVDVAVDGKDFHFTANYQNVKYWAEFPKVDFKL